MSNDLGGFVAPAGINPYSANNPYSTDAAAAISSLCKGFPINGDLTGTDMPGIRTAICGAFDQVYGVCEALYSFRHVFSAYTGPLLRVIRIADSKLLDVYGDRTTGRLNIAALVKFAKGGDVCVDTIYDQSATALHLYWQSSSGARSGSIVLAGVFQPYIQLAYNSGVTTQGYVGAVATRRFGTQRTLMFAGAPIQISLSNAFAFVQYGGPGAGFGLMSQGSFNPMFMNGGGANVIFGGSSSDNGVADEPRSLMVDTTQGGGTTSMVTLRRLGGANVGISYVGGSIAGGQLLGGGTVRLGGTSASGTPQPVIRGYAEFACTLTNEQRDYLSAALYL